VERSSGLSAASVRWAITAWDVFFIVDGSQPAQRCSQKAQRLRAKLSTYTG